MGLSLRGTTSGAIDINAPAIAGNNTITLPGDNGSANQFFKNSTTAGIVTYSSMIEDTSGNIGIGTDNPGIKLDVNGDIRAVDGTAPEIIVSDNFVNKRFIFGYTQSPVGHNLGSKILADGLNIGYYTRLGQNGSHIFYTNNSGSDAERLRISSNGDVGIGTDNPSRSLDICFDSESGIELRNYTAGKNLQFLVKDDGTGRIVQPSDRSLQFDRAGTVSLAIASNGDVGIGTADPSQNLTVVDTSAHVTLDLKSSAAEFSEIRFSDTDAAGRGKITYDHGNDAVQIVAAGSEVIRITSTHNVGVRTDNPARNFDVEGNAQIINSGGTAFITGRDRALETYGAIGFADADTVQITAGSGGSRNVAMEFRTAASGTETTRMSITSEGRFTNKTTNTGSVNQTGWTLGELGSGGGYLLLKRNGSNVVYINRGTDDGNLIQFYQDNTEHGNINVSSGTVSLSGAHLSRWSQLPDGAERTEILRGSVLSNLDEMCEWAYDAEPEVLWTEDDELPEGVNVGDVKTPAKAAGTEDNEQLNRMKVSDVEGDRNVAGVFQSWDDDDDTYTNDFYCAMTGDFVIRIAQGVTVERGDLLMSAGDGTAKPQEDDIIRSKTIAKVTSTNVSCTYDDGSYCVPCVLMAC